MDVAAVCSVSVCMATTHCALLRPPLRWSRARVTFAADVAQPYVHMAAPHTFVRSKLTRLSALRVHTRACVRACALSAIKTDAYLTEQGVAEEVSAAFTKFWKKERAGVHEALVKAASWNNKLDSMSWRLDVLTKSRHVDELSNPAAIVELKIEKIFPAATDVCRFEMDGAKLDEVVAQVEQIEARIEALTA